LEFSRPEYDLILRLVPKSAPATGLAQATEWKATPLKEPQIDPATINAIDLVALYCAACHGPGLRGGMQRGLV